MSTAASERRRFLLQLSWSREEMISLATTEKSICTTKQVQGKLITGTFYNGCNLQTE